METTFTCMAYRQALTVFEIQVFEIRNLNTFSVFSIYIQILDFEKYLYFQKYKI